MYQSKKLLLDVAFKIANGEKKNDHNMSFFVRSSSKHPNVNLVSTFPPKDRWGKKTSI